MGDAGANQRAHETARRGACGGADGGGGQPARGNDRPEAGNGEQAETGQQAGATADHAADAGARGGRGDFLDVSVLFADILVRDQADLGGRHAGGLDGGHGIAGLRVGVVNATDGFHDVSFRL